MSDILRRDIKVRSSDGSEFDCYLVIPASSAKVPAIVLASAVHPLAANAKECGLRREIAIITITTIRPSPWLIGTTTSEHPLGSNHFGISRFINADLTSQ